MINMLSKESLVENDPKKCFVHDQSVLTDSKATSTE